ncbi:MULTISPECIES: quaternary ammonium compound efflux SMR transporter SugE [Fictibacillus]|jgi:quaternary ammonium compound-resistance protein SugE|uniref:quaternary ammonium compound efflux SMR transporter SugE n=1 Tax=Fictibacillus TaxID=1329200 RepID=UPI001028BC15|nr:MULTISPECIES: quaternary ammonium compound efflux SMR transporter SugE [Fictibacillus]RZT24212.1 quaternary ammonium compound-resistance protein SugE [Fictibacillus sp. BK138]
MAWVYLFVAGIFEIVWAIGLKYTNGFTRLWPSVVTVVGMIISFYYLSQATKVLPIGTAYTIWTGIGAAGAVILGIVLFGEPKTLLRLTFLAFVITGIIGLKITAGSQ